MKDLKDHVYSQWIRDIRAWLETQPGATEFDGSPLDGIIRVMRHKDERLASAEALLSTACDAWECGQMVWNQEGVLLSDYKAAMLPRAWYEAAKGWRDE